MRMEVVMIILLCFLATQVDAVDYRCICKCPRNLIAQNASIFVSTISDPKECSCLSTVPTASVDSCLNCECRYEYRNGVLIKVIIYFILVFSGLAIVIMVSDLLLEKPRHQSEGLSISADFPQLEATSELSGTDFASATEDSITSHGLHSLQDLRLISQQSSLDSETSASASLRSFSSRAAQKAERWMSSIHEQRANVYERHKLLS